MVDDDLVAADRKHRPIDNILRRRWKRKATAMVAFFVAVSLASTGFASSCDLQLDARRVRLFPLEHQPPS